MADRCNRGDELDPDDADCLIASGYLVHGIDLSVDLLAEEFDAVPQHIESAATLERLRERVQDAGVEGRAVLLQVVEQQLRARGEDPSCRREPFAVAAMRPENRWDQK